MIQVRQRGVSWQQQELMLLSCFPEDRQAVHSRQEQFEHWGRSLGVMFIAVAAAVKKRKYAVVSPCKDAEIKHANLQMLQEQNIILQKRQQ
uniref:Uncharacterized protein n=1 Tax=Spironucleus salmonicida TaxID=348837 RepID=V6LTQ3_9EUKA|eukprot:EST48032.1 Hypothetical protein SS50377_11840 [Spironucleus salmonicida]